MVATITASAETLVQQAPATVAGYLNAARRHIDEQFGDGYAAKHPELVAAFVQACAQDFDTAISAATRQAAAGSLTCISDSLDRVATAISELDVG